MINYAVEEALDAMDVPDDTRNGAEMIASNDGIEDDDDIDNELALTDDEAASYRDLMYRTGELLKYNSPLVDPTAAMFILNEERERMTGRRITNINGVTDDGALSITVRQARGTIDALARHVEGHEEQALRALKSGDVVYTLRLYGDRPFDKKLPDNAFERAGGWASIFVHYLAANVTAMNVDDVDG